MPFGWIERGVGHCQGEFQGWRSHGDKSKLITCVYLHMYIQACCTRPGCSEPVQPGIQRSQGVGDAAPVLGGSARHLMCWDCRCFWVFLCAVWGMQDWNDGLRLMDPTQGPPCEACLYSEKGDTAAPAEGSDDLRSCGRDLVQPAAAIQSGAGSMMWSQSGESFKCLKRVFWVQTGVLLLAAQCERKSRVSKEQNFSEYNLY